MGYIKELRRVVGSRPLINTGGRIIIENKKGEILLIRRLDYDLWGFPAGGLEIGESAESSIKRETQEETGLIVGQIELIGVSSDPAVETVSYPNGDQVQNMSLVFYSDDFEGDLETITNETSDARFFAIDRMPAMIENEKRSIEFLKAYKKTGTILLR